MATNHVQKHRISDANSREKRFGTLCAAPKAVYWTPTRSSERSMNSAPSGIFDAKRSGHSLLRPTWNFNPLGSRDRYSPNFPFRGVHGPPIFSLTQSATPHASDQ